MDARPEDANARQHLFLVRQQTQFFPAFILQIMIHVGRNAQVPGNVQMVVRRLKVFDPAAT